MKQQPIWDFSFAVGSVAVAAAVVIGWRPPGSAVALAAVVAIAVLYFAIGRRLEPEGRGNGWYAAATISMFVAGALAVSTVSYLLFAICPVMFLVLPLNRAIVAVVTANLAPVVTGFLRGGYDWGFVATYGPIFVMTAVASVGLGLFIARVVDQSEERAELIRELESSRAEVSRLSHEAGVAAERTRLAGEIHDTLAQGFTSIITLVQAVDPRLADSRLRLAVDTAKENLAESRALVAALTPSALGSGSQPDALRRQLARAGESDTAVTSFRTTGESRPLPTSVEVVVLRVAQEALTNVRRHAGAGKAEVLLAYAGERVRLTVRDDGRGFAAGESRGFGLDGMRARVDQVGGTLVVHSAAGAGTTIELEVPA